MAISSVVTNGVSNVITNGVKGKAALPAKLNVKTEPPLADILTFSILLVFSRLLFSFF